MKKIGIVADNYKVERFKKELKDLKTKTLQIEYWPYKESTTAILIYVNDDDFNKATKEINAITIKVESHFKRSN